MSIPTLDAHKDFSGSAEELAELATTLCAGLGLAGEELTVRLVRDYAQRDILSRPERQGKEAVYTWRHLVELVAARALLADGWPLAKIAEHLRLTSLEDLLLLVPGQAGGAVAVANRIRARTSVGEPSVPMFSRRALAPSTERMAYRSQSRAELDTAMRQLAGPGARPRITPMTRIALDEDIQLLAATERLRNLSLAEADAIGRAVTAAIIDWLTAKGGKQS